jgi:flavin reductase (DIM6/NTAB) family NADH-FMN oxidoreductase RutF
MQEFLSIKPKDEVAVNTYNYLVSSVAPRPIALASTINKKGEVNLSPFSFFNIISANPPILAFSPVNRGVDASKKDTLVNIEEIKEVVINIVNHDMVQQMSLSSADYSKNVNEFEKAGFTMLESEEIKPYRVKEAPVQYECKVSDIINFGSNGGAGNLIICEIVKMHFNKNILNEKNRIDPHKIDLVARAGGNFYSRMKDGYFEIAKPFSSLGIGFDNLPESVRNSSVLSGNDLGQLASIGALPQPSEIKEFQAKHKIENNNKHLLVKEYLNKNEIKNAWMILL